MGILQLSPVSLLTGTTSFCLLQFSLHPTCLYVYPSVWWKCTFKVDPTAMNPVFNHVHMCYLHLRFSFGHSVTLWSLETRACGHEVICGPTLSLMDSLCMWQRWFTRGPGRRCERKCFIPVEGKNSNKAAASSYPLTFYGVNSLLWVKNTKWLDRIRDSGLTKVRLSSTEINTECADNN